MSKHTCPCDRWDYTRDCCPYCGAPGYALRSKRRWKVWLSRPYGPSANRKRNKHGRQHP